jgi:hypothetical protein
MVKYVRPISVVENTGKIMRDDSTGMVIFQLLNELTGTELGTSMEYFIEVADQPPFGLTVRKDGIIMERYIEKTDQLVLQALSVTPGGYTETVLQKKNLMSGDANGIQIATRISN